MSLISLTEITPISKFTHERTSYTLREVFINPSHVVCIRIEEDYKHKLLEGMLPPGLDERQEFSRVVFSSSSAHGSMVVVGSPTLLQEKMHKKQLLKG